MIVTIKRLFKKKPTTLLELFKYIKSTGLNTGERSCGICLLLRDYFPIEDWDRLPSLFKKWPHFSGINAYPIPPSLDYQINSDDCSRELAPIRCFKRTFYKWDKSTEYGKARWAFIDWAIDELEGKHD